MRGTKFSTLRKYLIAYAHGHNNTIRLLQLKSLGPYSRTNIRTVVWRMKNEGVLMHTGVGVYKCLI